MKSYSAAFIDRLNRPYNAGVFLKAVVVAHENATDYFVHFGEPVTFQGHTYQPLQMQWEGVDASSTMQLPSVKITVANVLGTAEHYIDTVNLLGRDVVLQFMHLDLLQNPADVEEVALQVQSIEMTSTTVSLLCGLNLGLNDSLPKDVMTRAEYPGQIDDVRRLTIV